MESNAVNEDPKPRILALIKFIDSRWSDQFRAGRIRMGSVASFRKQYESDFGRRQDFNENLLALYQPDKSIISINDNIISDLAGPVDVRLNNDDFSYLFCMTAITDLDIDRGGGCFSLDSALVNLGDSAIIVTNVSEFLRRLRSCISETGWLSGRSDESGKFSSPIEYVDLDTFHGRLGLFRKSSQFAFQHEWRVALADALEQGLEEIFLEVGDLTDITTVMASEHLLKTKFTR